MKLLIAIPSARRDSANATAAKNFKDASNVFATQASATGAAPTTHYACGIECGESEQQIRGLAAYVGATCATLADDPAAAWRSLGLLPVTTKRTL